MSIFAKTFKLNKKESGLIYFTYNLTKKVWESTVVIEIDGEFRKQIFWHKSRSGAENFLENYPKLLLLVNKMPENYLRDKRWEDEY